VRICVSPSKGLQVVCNALTNGGTIVLQGGATYYGDPANPGNNLVLTNGNINFVGEGQLSTIIGSPVLIQSSFNSAENIWFKRAGAAYGVRIGAPGGNPFLARNYFKRCQFGATSSGSGDGPVDGIQSDGAGLFIAEHCLFAFCTNDGVAWDKTGAQPNTTSQFIGCSAVGNARFGYYINGSNTCVEIIGGSIQDNVSSEVKLAGVSGVNIIAVDLETAQNHALGMIQASGTNIIIERCTVSRNAGTSARFVLAQTAGRFTMTKNRVTGWGATEIARLDENCTDCLTEPNWLDSGAYVDDRSVSA